MAEKEPVNHPTVSDWVLYTLTQYDVDTITPTRGIGNPILAGDVYPALVVRTFGGAAANLMVYLDGGDPYWATSRTEGEGAGHWTRPVRGQ